jgi:hypothetical protein
VCCGDLSRTVMAVESWPCLKSSNYVNLWKSVFLKISSRIPRVWNILEMSRSFSPCLAHSQSRLAVSCASLIPCGVWSRSGCSNTHSTRQRRMPSLTGSNGTLCRERNSSHVLRAWHGRAGPAILQEFGQPSARNQNGECYLAE